MAQLIPLPHHHLEITGVAKGDFGGGQQNTQNAATSEPLQDFAKTGFGSWAQVFGHDLQPEPARPFESETGFSGATVGFERAEIASQLRPSM